MKKIGYILFLIFSFIQKIEGQKFSIITSGHSNYSIMIRKNADTDENKAAKILQDYVKYVTKVDLPIIYQENISENVLKNTILISKQKNLNFLNHFEDLKKQGIGIITKRNNVYILGGEDKGIFYAVYTFIEDYLGCRFFSPSKKFIPQKKDVFLPIDLKNIYRSPFIYRESFYYGSFTPSEEYLQWNKLHSYNDVKQSQWGVFVRHNIEDFIPVSKYFTKRPEFFALVGGKRITDQLDYSNPELQKEFIRIVGEMLKKDSNLTSIAINPNDNENYCECSVCQRNEKKYLAKSSNLILLINSISEKYPNINFSTLAYRANRKPPIGMKLANNVKIVLADIETNKVDPIENSQNIQNVYFRNDLLKWKELTNDILIWHYISWFPHSLAPFPIFDKIQADIKYFSKQDVKGVFLEGDGGLYADFSDLKAYLAGKLLWNPNIDREVVIREYLDYEFGLASSDIFAYYKTLESNFNLYQSNLNTGDESIATAMNGYLNPKLIIEYKNILNKAKSKVPKNSINYVNIDKLELGLLYFELETLKQNKAKANQKVFTEKINEFNNKLKKYNIDKINYYLLPVDEYMKSFKY